MKNKIIFGAMLFAACTFSMQVNAQLKVSNSGKVGICVADTIEPVSQLSIGHRGMLGARLSVIAGNGTSGTLPQYGLYSKLSLSLTSNVQYAVYGQVSGMSSKLVGVCGYAMPDVIGGHAIGVMGIAKNGLLGWNYGVVGMLMPNSSSGIGVFGTNESSESFVSGSYAGYFKGQTKVNGDFYCTSISTTSDVRLKTNIAKVKTEEVQKIQKLRAIQFNWQQIEDLHSEDTIKKMYFSDDTDYKRSHYGFVAQEVQKLFPELVHEDEEGYLGVNYVELIPLLVQAIQELSAEVSELKANIDSANL